MGTNEKIAIAGVIVVLVLMLAMGIYTAATINSSSTLTAGIDGPVTPVTNAQETIPATPVN